MPLQIRKPAVRTTAGPIPRGSLYHPRKSAPQFPSPLTGEPFEQEPLAHGSSHLDQWPHFDDGFDFEDD